MKIIIGIITLSFFISSITSIIFGGADIPKIDIWKEIGNFKIGDDKKDENN